MKSTKPEIKFNALILTRQANPSDVGFNPAGIQVPGAPDGVRQNQVVQVAVYPMPPVTTWRINESACLTIVAHDQPVAVHHGGTWDKLELGYIAPPDKPATDQPPSQPPAP